MKKKAVRKVVKNKVRKATKAPAKRANLASARSSIGLLPLGEKVVIRPLSDEEMGTKSPSGIIIPDGASKEKSDRGVVVSVGPGRVGDDNERIPMSVKPGDRVIFQWGDKIEYGGRDYYLVSESNISAIIE